MTDDSKATPAAANPWARQQEKPVQRQTPRLRRVVESLPDWEPLPPGEILVKRPDGES